MKRIFFFILIISSFLKLKAQEIMVTGGLNMPLAPYSTKDILDSKNGRALNGFNFKIESEFFFANIRLITNIQGVNKNES
jgi:hypothetical protein